MERVIGGAFLAGALAVSTSALQPVSAQTPGAGVLALDGGAFIGVSVRPAETGSRSDDAAGVVIDRVGEGTPAERAGLRAGDRVLQFGGERVRSVPQFIRLVREAPPGQQVEVIVERSGSRQTVHVTPEARRTALDRLPDALWDLDSRLRALPWALDFDRDGWRATRARAIGLEFAALGSQLAEYFGVTRGVLITSVVADSPAHRAGLRAGDVLTAIGGRSVTSPGEAVAELRRADSGVSVEFRVTRDRKDLTVNVEMPQRPDTRQRLRPGSPRRLLPA